MVINWINCADQMPLNNTNLVIGKLGTLNPVAVPGICIWSIPDPSPDWAWTEYTKEKWDYLNKS